MQGEGVNGPDEPADGHSFYRCPALSVGRLGHRAEAFTDRRGGSAGPRHEGQRRGTSPPDPDLITHNTSIETCPTPVGGQNRLAAILSGAPGNGRPQNNGHGQLADILAGAGSGSAFC